MDCKKCHHGCTKNGFQANGVQRYYCKHCNTHQQKAYSYRAYGLHIDESLYRLIINSCGITDISRVLGIAKNTVSKRILKLAKQIKQPLYNDRQQSYEVDELYTKVAGKPCWVSYAINRHTKHIISFVIGNRSKEHLAHVINKLILLNPKRIYTDKLPQYKSLIPMTIHNNARFQTNRIERFNLNLRTHIKCLSRKTICFSKSIIMLQAIIRIYFWGHALKLA